ncbi:MAG: TetR family transcriptional regulator, partial [Chitinophagaceae bacterium]
MRRTNKERTEIMRLMLMAAARALFVAKGYAETATPEIASAAGV